MNWLAIFCAGLAYFILGFVWYSLLFGKIWAAEQLRHCGGDGGAGPAKREFAGMLIANWSLRPRSPASCGAWESWTLLPP
jgi:hypothetical protein